MQSSRVLSRADGIGCTAARPPSAPLGGEGLRRAPTPTSLKAARHKAPAFLCSPFPPHSPFPPAPRRLCWLFTDRMDQQVRSFRATMVATAPTDSAGPFPGDVPLSHGQSPALSADRCRFPPGLCDLLCQILATPMCFFVPAATAAPSPQLHFQSGSHMLGLCGSGVPLPSPAPGTPIFLLLLSFSLTLGLC